MGVLIMVAGYNAGVFGLDRYVVPFFKKKFGKDVEGKKLTA
jgi:thiosulfate dehydrogenase (quinone) large subunit